MACAHRCEEFREDQEYWRLQLVRPSVPFRPFRAGSDASCSGPQHIEEIRAAGLELPAVNQIEVRPRNVLSWILLDISLILGHVPEIVAASVLPATADREVLQGTGDRRAGLLAPRTGQT